MRNLFGLDQAISFTLLTRLSSIFGGIGSVFLVTKHFSSEMQGYYYTFGSLIALQIFFELGLTYAITQFVSHEMAGLSWQKDKTVQGRKSSKKRLQSIIHFSFFLVFHGSNNYSRCFDTTRHIILQNKFAFKCFSSS